MLWQLSPGGPITVHVKADSSISWEIQIVEGPDFLVSAPGDVPLAPVAFGMGSMTLPAFTPTQAYTVEVACSGAGTLTIGSPGFTHTATPNCVGRTVRSHPRARSRETRCRCRSTRRQGWDGRS